LHFASIIVNNKLCEKRGYELVIFTSEPRPLSAYINLSTYMPKYSPIKKFDTILFLPDRAFSLVGSVRYWLADNVCNSNASLLPSLTQSSQLNLDFISKTQNTARRNINKSPKSSMDVNPWTIVWNYSPDFLSSKW